MTKKDVPLVHRLLREYLSQFNLVPDMNQEEVEHWLLPRENIIDTFVVEVKTIPNFLIIVNVVYSHILVLLKPSIWCVT